MAPRKYTTIEDTGDLKPCHNSTQKFGCHLWEHSISVFYNNIIFLWSEDFPRLAYHHVRDNFWIQLSFMKLSKTPADYPPFGHASLVIMQGRTCSWPPATMRMLKSDISTYYILCTINDMNSAILYRTTDSCEILSEHIAYWKVHFYYTITLVWGSRRLAPLMLKHLL